MSTKTTEALRVETLARILTAPKVIVLCLGSALLVNVSLGPMAAEIGAASVAVWILTAFVGLLQCVLIADLGRRYADKAGGVPAYIREALTHRSAIFGVVAAWGYWSGWIPGVAVHLMLAAGYIKAAFWPDARVIPLMLALGVLLYTANYFGVRLAVWTSGVMALCALTPLTIILTASLLRDGGWRASFFSFGGDRHAAALAATPLSFAKWMFVAVWSSYAGEMAATLTGELRDRARDTARVIVLAGFVTFVAFAIVPVVLVGAVGADALANDPYVVFLTAARGIFGARGSAVISIMLIAALLCGAQLFVISSSRALYQLSRDNLAFRSWSRLNRYGVPVGSLGWDAAVTVSLVAIFRERVVDVVAAANVSYLLVFVLLPWTYLHVSARERSHDGEFALRRVGVPIARGVLLLNAALLIVGGVQWGLVVTIVGAGLALMGVPVYLFLDRTGALRNNPPRFCRPHRGGSFGDSRCPGR